MYVTHDQVEAMTMGDRVAVMRDGRLVAGRTRRRCSTTGPADLFVAGFIGSPAMNFLRRVLFGAAGHSSNCADKACGFRSRLKRWQRLK